MPLSAACHILRIRSKSTRVLIDHLSRCTPGYSLRMHTVARKISLCPRGRPSLLLVSSSSKLCSLPFAIKERVRTIFIQTESTPNADALKFLPNHRVLPEGLASPFLEYLSPRSSLAPPHPSPLAARLFDIDGVSSIFYGSDFITVTKAPEYDWAHIKPEVFGIITDTVTSGEAIVTTLENKSIEAGLEGYAQDTLSYDERDSEVVGMIKELLETRIRPAIQEDGGDIEYRGFENGKVSLKLRGACRTCDSSTVTLKNGIENMLMHYIEEVKGITQVLDHEEEIAMQEFAKFEAKLQGQKRQDMVFPSAD